MSTFATGSSMPPRASVVLPVYNAEDTLENCLTSLVGLDYPPESIEILAIDNNSTDRSPSILTAFDESVTVLREPRQGAAAARNCGAWHAHHPILAFVDADCVADRSWLREIVGALSSDPELAAVGGRILALQPANQVETFGEKIHDHEAAITGGGPPGLIGMNAAIRASIFHQIGGFDEAFRRAQDSDLAYKLHLAGHRIGYASTAVVRHRNERTLGGLLAEGFTHGLWEVKLSKKHADTVYRDRKRINIYSYRRLARMAIDCMPGVAGTSKAGDEPRCRLAFYLGKKVGAITGSVRFGHLRL